jgi:hypothetical protein
MNDKYVQVLIDTVVSQRNEALNSVASLQAQLKVTTEELESLRKEKEDTSEVVKES